MKAKTTKTRKTSTQKKMSYTTFEKKMKDKNLSNAEKEKIRKEYVDSINYK